MGIIKNITTCQTLMCDVGQKHRPSFWQQLRLTSDEYLQLGRCKIADIETFLYDLQKVSWFVFIRVYMIQHQCNHTHRIYPIAIFIVITIAKITCLITLQQYYENKTLSIAYSLICCDIQSFTQKNVYIFKTITLTYRVIV